MKGKGSVFGGILLIGGSCIGAGMLGLPILTGLCGFFPSIILLLVGWLFMTATALLLVEANGWFAHPVHLLSMTQKTLGKIGRGICWATYLFLFYALLVAYISGIGSLSSTFWTGITPWAGSLLFVLLFGWMIYLGTRKVDLFNRFLMIGKIGFFALLVLAGVFYIRPTFLLRVDPSYMTAALPLLVISFGFHNMIPSLTSYLKGDLKRVRLTIIGGSLLILAIYLIWEIVVLGIIPLEGENGLLMSLSQDREASQSIAAILKTPAVSLFAQGLAFFALLTSFLAQSLSLVHFLADGLKVDYKRQEKWWLCALALLPPLALAISYPQLFFKALNFAGGICAVILFGILPVTMIWIGRYKKGSKASYQLFGGKISLVLIFLFALFILGVQLQSML
ncbi:MAG: putative tyrosine/tryptophan transport protein [Chlamydiota bacterium]|jgi:tyrosine-specific transport protein